MRKHLIASIVGAPLFLFFINSTVGNKGGCTSFLYVGTMLFMGYVIANFGSIVYKEISIAKIMVDTVFLYVISFFVVIASRSAKYPYNLVLIAITLLVLLIIKERVTDWIKKSPARRC